MQKIQLAFPGTPAFIAAAIEYLQMQAKALDAADTRPPALAHGNPYQDPYPSEFAMPQPSDPVPESALLDRDADGRTWDARIDSSNRKKNADGRWHARKGVQPFMRDAVLREIAGAPPAAVAVPPPPPPPAAAAVPPPPPPVAAPDWNAGTLIGAAVAAGKINDLTAECARRGCSNLGLLYNFEAIYNELAEAVGICHT